jgi:trimethylamine--corrinoid protein Co-methyltransferase
MISDWRNWETWVEAGRPEAKGRANQLARRFIAAYERPPMEPARREELDAFLARRLAEGGVPTDY